MGLVAAGKTVAEASEEPFRRGKKGRFILRDGSPCTVRGPSGNDGGNEHWMTEGWVALWRPGDGELTSFLDVDSKKNGDVRACQFDRPQGTS